MKNPVELNYYTMKPEAELDMQLLRQKGIEVRLVPENHGAFESNLSIGPVKLFVEEAQLEEAKTTIGKKSD